MRKSLNVGPFKYTLSKSGINVSVGAPGLRVGMGPKGHYVSIGGNRFTYKKPIDKIAPSLSTIPFDNQLNNQGNTDEGISDFREIDSIDADFISDSSSVKMVAEIKEKSKKWRIWPWFLGLWIFSSLYFMIFISGPFLYFVLLLTLSLPLFAAQVDLVRKSVVIFYDLDDKASATFSNLTQSILKLRTARKVWHVEAEADVYDKKRNAGADGLIRRKATSIKLSKVPFITSNMKFASIGVGKQRLYFLPDVILIADKFKVGAISYENLNVTQDIVKFIESGKIPRDSEIIDYTWQYVNKSGGPDKRFNPNPRLPVCSYDLLEFSSLKGIREQIQLSRKGLSVDLINAIEGMKRIFNETRVDLIA